MRAEGDDLEYVHATQEASGPALPQLFMGENAAYIL